MEFPEEERPFHLDFMRRSLALVQKYEGPYDATNLLNCLLGLLVVPNERLFDLVPTESIGALANWGIDPKSIEQYGKCECGDRHPKNLRHLVKSLRHAVAHFQVKPVNEDGKCVGFTFSNRNRFRARIKVDEMRVFVEKLATHLEQQLNA
jgi:hypothetical protein